MVYSTSQYVMHTLYKSNQLVLLDSCYYRLTYKISKAYIFDQPIAIEANQGRAIQLKEDREKESATEFLTKLELIADHKKNI